MEHYRQITKESDCSQSFLPIGTNAVNQQQSPLPYLLARTRIYHLLPIHIHLWSLQDVLEPTHHHFHRNRWG